MVTFVLIWFAVMLLVGIAGLVLGTKSDRVD
jgi:hypothetical protein